jgi:hypothetical protein
VGVGGSGGGGGKKYTHIHRVIFMHETPFMIWPINIQLRVIILPEQDSHYKLIIP